MTDTIRAASDIEIDAGSDGIRVRIAGADAVLSWRWLRDHGEDPASFDPVTHQRRIDVLGTDPLPAEQAAADTIDGRPVLRLVWPDEPTNTWISEATLRSLLAPPSGPRAVLWDRPGEAHATPIDTSSVLDTDDALRRWLDDITSVGYGVLTGFEGGHHEVAALADRLGGVMRTIFGTTWDLAADVGLHDDTAYSRTFLAPHTDGTYLDQAPRLQVFCCTERDGTGGESVIVDAFAVAETLRRDHPHDFDVLTTVPVPAHYIEPGVELRATRPAIRTDADGSVVQVSLNNYDRSPMLLPAPDMDAFYAAYGRLHDLANDRSRWKSIRLEPGDVLINDNWRVLHGRQAYTGSRRFIGCYIGHDDFENTCRRKLGV